jgi:hypothetical protein
LTTLRNIILVVLITAAAGCSKTEPERTSVARLDNQTLALEDIRAHIDTSSELSQAQIQQYIQRWLTEESLYREAVERGLDRTDEMNQKMDEVRKQLSINTLLEKEVYSNQSADFSQQEIRQYYDAHIKEFSLMHDVVLVSYALFRNRDAATEFRNIVLKGSPWSAAVNQQITSIQMVVDSSYRTQANLLPPELWRVAANAINRELSFPINTSNGYYILVVWKNFKQGQTADLPLVEQEIRGRLTIERRRKQFDSFVENLRAKHSIEVFFSGTTDSTNSSMQK